MTLNKSASANTASQLYQDNYSGRAETGLTGDDHFHVKVSPDGATWTEAINIDPTSGFVSMPHTAGAANGLATFDPSGKVPAAQLPALSTNPSVSLTSAETSAATAPGSPVAFAAAGSFRRAQANALANSASLGIATASIAAAASGAIATAGALTLTTAQWDAIVTGESGGLTPGALYFVDPATPGNLTATAPATAGQIVAPVGRAVSPTVLVIQIGQPVQL